MKDFNWDPVWSGVLLTMKIAIGHLTRPLAVNLMVSCCLTTVRMEANLPCVGWPILSFIAAAAAVLFFPELALWLPRQLGY